MKKIFSVIIIICIITSCFLMNSSDYELVMPQGMVIQVTNPSGTMTIAAGKGFTRTYSWEGKTEKITLWPRNERWYGSRGAYRPGGGSKVHTVVEEGQQHFCSIKEAIEWLSWQNKRMQYVCSNDGLVVGWHSSKDPNSSDEAIGVEVWQFYVQGEKPTNMPPPEIGHALSVTYRETEERTGSVPLPGDFHPSCPRKINGRWYSGKAIDYMSERKISPETVERCIASGESYTEGHHIFYNHILDKQFNIVWVMSDSSGRVALLGN